MKAVAEAWGVVMTISYDHAAKPGNCVWWIQEPCWGWKQSSHGPPGTDRHEENMWVEEEQKMRARTGEARGWIHILPGRTVTAPDNPIWITDL